MTSSSVLKMKAKKTSSDTGLGQNAKNTLAKELTKVLADSYLLFMKTQVVHWNVVGPLFTPVHTLTEQQYNELFTAIDEIAERIRALGAPAPVSLKELIKESTIKEETGVQSAEKMIQSLVSANEAVAKQARKVATKAGELGDQATEDMMVGRIATHEKAVWMLSALLQ